MKTYIVKYFLEHNSIVDAIAAAELAEESKHQELVLLIFDKSLEKGASISSVLEKLSGSKVGRKEMIEYILKVRCIDEGNISSAKKVAEFIGRKLEDHELDEILVKCIDEGNILSAELVAKLVDYKLDKEDLEFILEKCVENNKMGDAQHTLGLLSSL